ncbi:Uncharacterised protein [uncultured archaeon]|nr:Uncharacterised protein [uncultured archaeon]
MVKSCCHAIMCMKPVFVLLAVSTIDGRIAKGSAHMTDWSSKEDKVFLHKKLDEGDAVVVGNNTYKTARGPLSRRNCIVFTRKVRGMKRESDYLVYLNPEKTSLEKFVSSMGYRKIVVLGGAKTYSYFLENGLVDEIFLTIEPVVFGSGISMFESGFKPRRFSLVSSRRLNRAGAVLLHYSSRKFSGALQ